MKDFITRVVILLSGFVHWGCNSPETPPAEVKLLADERTLDFGQVWEQSNFQWQVKLHNPNSHSIEVEELHTACSCVQASPQSFVVHPGETASVDLTLDLRTDSVRSSPEVGGREFYDFSAVVMPKFANEETKQADVWRVTGKVRRPFAGIPRSLNFGTVSFGTADQPTARIQFECANGVSIVDATCDENYGTANVISGHGGQTTVEVLLAHRKLGRFNFPLRLSGVTTDGISLPGFDVSVMGRVTGDVELSPPELALGLLHPGQTINDTVLIRSRSGQTLTIDSASCADNLISCSPVSNLSHRQGDRQAYVIKVNPDRKPGNHSSTVEFRVRSGDREPSTVSFHLSYSTYDEETI